MGTSYRYIVQAGQNIYDVALQEYGDVGEGLFALLEGNGLELDSDLDPGQELKLMSDMYFPQVVNVVAKEPLPDNYSYTVQSGQNLYDVLLQEYGGLDNMFEYLEQIGKQANDDISAGDKIVLRRSQVQNKDVVAYYVNKQKMIATGNISRKKKVLGTYGALKAISTTDGKLLLVV